MLSARVIRSPAWNPARAAALPGTTSMIRFDVNGRPNAMKKVVNSRIARTKLAPGPARMISARCQSGLNGRYLRSAPTPSRATISWRKAARSSRLGTLATFSSPANFT